MTVEHLANVDVLGQPLQESTYQVPVVTGIGILGCEVAELWNEVMYHITSTETIKGSDADIRVRRTFYSRLRRFREELPIRFLCETNLTPSTCFLRFVLFPCVRC